MLISEAWAQTGAPVAAAPGDIVTSLLPFILILFIFWMLIWRPQLRKQKEHMELMQNLKRGDRVLTSGGLIGNISKIVDDTTVEVEFAEGVKIKCARHHVTDLIDRAKSSAESKKAK
ncbi:MAG: preprotein translocase subunit YajC [Proteobacteria bacterium]|nr:preprotein translocase subunit YajC [Pseudomonadota bacterium]